MPKEPIPQDYVKGLCGKESTLVFGDPKDAKTIAKKSLAVVEQFSRAVFKQDIESAYALCANEYRVGMPVSRFVAELKKADTQFGGAPVELMVEQISGIYADAPARQRSNSDGQWPKETPKPNKRATVGTFWFIVPKEKRGRWAFFWVTEEAEGYRIAKFRQYLQ